MCGAPVSAVWHCFEPHLLPSVHFLQNTSLVLALTLLLDFPFSWGVSLDHHRGDSSLSFRWGLCRQALPVSQYQVNFLPSNFNITLPLGVYSTSTFRTTLNRLLNSYSFPDTFPESRDLAKFLYYCTPD